jgi:hypothetical protein
MNALNKSIAPTPQQSFSYQAMYDYFNAELFGGELPPVLLNFSRHSPRTLGFFAPQRWESASGTETTHEISLNPAHLKTRSPADVAATLVHEMVHLWQQEFGSPSRSGYHNHQWAAKMEDVGLIPSNTGAPGGKKVGQSMSHYIQDGGRFLQAFERMPKAFLLPWVALPEGGGKGPAKPRAKSKVKYTCLNCSLNVWGKPGLSVGCLECGTKLLEEGEAEDEAAS